MRSKRLIAVITAIGAMLTVAGLTVSGGANATAAGYTSVNEAVDGTGHCKNGNPNNNCNIYDSKEAVWLNGGPSAFTGNGTYFFAVVAPGGHADPNDTSDKLLSLDDHTNRTYTVTNGVVSYAGTHTFNDNKIRLMDYADTPNNGGVYGMVICSLADGYPVNANDCKYDSFKIQSDDTPPPPADDLVVSKNAAGSYTQPFTWTIVKSVDKTTVKQIGGSATFNYTVTATRTAGQPTDVNVAGTITVTNPNVDDDNAVVAVDHVDVTDELSDGTDCTVTNGTDQLLTTFNTQFAYSCNLTGLPQGQLDNTATASWPDQSLSNGTFLAASSADFTFPAIKFTANEVDECVNVTDTYNGSLGTACGNPNPAIFTYSRTIPIPQFGCLSYPNTASFTTNDTGATGSSSQSVTVCGPAKTGALTMGFWKNTNGNGLISAYCAPAGKTSLAAYLSGLGGGSGPFSDAAGKTCSQLVTYVNGIFSKATATNMNNMLKAQMLATALDAYFSDSDLGGTSTPAGNKKPPSQFLPITSAGIGGFVMDLTVVCPMVDNTTAGTASCKNGSPSTNAHTTPGSGLAASSTVQELLDFYATTPSPFNGSTTNPIWYGGNRTLQEVAKNIFDQINNQQAFAP